HLYNVKLFWDSLQYLILKIILGLNVYADQLVKIQDYIWKSENLNRIIIGNVKPSSAKRLAIFPTYKEDSH
ncbi:MAG: hypothetical protein WA130_06480, partial [Candidatus Methanoperedens sp.]